MQACGAVALDSTGADISSSIVVVDVTPCATGDECPACAITFAAAGLCQPGAYLYLYRFVSCMFTHSQICLFELVPGTAASAHTKWSGRFNSLAIGSADKLFAYAVKYSMLSTDMVVEVSTGMCSSLPMRRAEQIHLFISGKA